MAYAGAGACRRTQIGNGTAALQITLFLTAAPPHLYSPNTLLNSVPEIFVVRGSTEDRLHQVYSLALEIRRHRQYNGARHVADTASHTTVLVVEFKQAIAKVEDDIEGLPLGP